MAIAPSFFKRHGTVPARNPSRHVSRVERRHLSAQQTGQTRDNAMQARQEEIAQS